VLFEVGVDLDAEGHVGDETEDAAMVFATDVERDMVLKGGGRIVPLVRSDVYEAAVGQKTTAS
jgi:hypothetical protein